MRIFVSVAAFCDPYLEFTLDSLFSQARHPQNISVAVIDQSFDAAREWLKAKPYWTQIRYAHLHPLDARGVSWARSLAFSLYNNEDYFLQIDSHTWFDPAWDQMLLDDIAVLQQQTAKPILTTYPPPFEFDEVGKPFKTLKPAGTIYALRVHPETTLDADNATLRFRVEHVRAAGPIEGFHVAGGFLFTLGQFVQAIPYDPLMYFHGEEQNLAIRAYTHGWTIIHPFHERIPLCHLYKQPNNEHKSHHWHPDYEAERAVKWTELKARADARLKGLVYEGKNHGAYGLGNVRTLDDFARLSGVDYPHRQLLPCPGPASL